MESVEQDVSGTIFREPIEMVSIFLVKEEMEQDQTKQILVWCGRDGELRVKNLQ